MLRSSLAAVLAVTLLFSTACNVASVVATLNTVEVAAEAALGTLGALGIVPAPTATLANAYLAAVSTAVDETVTETASKDTAGQKAVKISGYFATAVLPNIPGLPPFIQNAFKAVDTAVLAFLSNLSPVVAAHVVLHQQASLGFSDHMKLRSIQHAARALHAKVAK